VRDDLRRDYAGTLRKVAEIGYTAVELLNAPVIELATLKALLADLGLQAINWPIGLAEWRGDPSRALTTARELGCSYIMFPFVPEQDRGDAAAYRALGDLLTDAGARAKEYGLGFAYHNHAFEFEKLDGRYAFDILMDAADPDLVKCEFDVYWAQYGGVDPADYIRKLGGRCRLIHLKDMAADAKRSFAEVGEGILDMDAIVAAGQAVNAEWYVVEQDESTKRPALDAARLSLQHMKTRGWA
jgi:sugar phosphate isomerase/epimerase